MIESMRRRMKACWLAGALAARQGCAWDPRPRKNFWQRYRDCFRVAWADGEPFWDYPVLGTDRVGVDPFDFIRYPSDMLKRIYERNLQLDPEACYIMEDKRLFAEHMAKAGLPHVRSLAESDPVNGLTVEGAPAEWETLAGRLRELKDGFFFKRSALWGGEGVTRVRYDGQAFVAAGGPIDIPAEMKKGPCLFQLPLRQIAALAALNESSANTFRVLTVRKGTSYEQLERPALRIGRAGRCTDNIGTGGFGLGVGADGRLQTWGICLQDGHGMSWHDRHLDHGYRFDSVTLPPLDAVIDLALAAHRACPRLFVVGWDVALTEEGPVLIEGNAKCGILNELVYHESAGRALDAAWEDCRKVDA